MVSEPDEPDLARREGPVGAEQRLDSGVDVVQGILRGLAGLAPVGEVVLVEDQNRVDVLDRVVLGSSGERARRRDLVGLAGEGVSEQVAAAARFGHLLLRRVHDALVGVEGGADLHGVVPVVGSGLSRTSVIGPWACEAWTCNVGT